MRGEAACAQPSDPADLLALAALQAQDIHKYSMQDITEEQRIMAAKKELAQFDQYQVWHESTPGFITDESEIPKHAIKVSSTYVERPKLTQKKKADGTLSTERESLSAREGSAHAATRLLASGERGQTLLRSRGRRFSSS